MDIYRMQREAEDRKLNGEPMLFIILGPLGSLEAEWLDPYFGLFTIPSQGDGFFMVKQFANAFPPLDFFWRDDAARTKGEDNGNG